MRKTLDKKFSSPVFWWLCALILISTPAIFAQAKDAPGQTEIVAAGGSFALEKAVTAGGGSQMSQGALNQTGTLGQTLAGVRSTGGNFSLYSGFWTPADLVPTAASAVVGGRVLTSSGAGIRNVQVTITFPSGEIRTTKSSAFGYYRFAEIPTGAIYVIEVASKKYSFSQPTQIRQVQDDIQDADFIADAL